MKLADGPGKVYLPYTLGKQQPFGRSGNDSMLVKLKKFMNVELEFQRWELVKYFSAAVGMFSPALVTFCHYLRLQSLLSFAAFTCFFFGILVIFKIDRRWTVPLVLFAIACSAYHICMGKPIGYQTMAAMYETNISESLGFFLSPLSIPLVLGGGAVAWFIIWFVSSPKPLPKLKKVTSIRRKYLTSLMFFSLLLFFLAGKGILYTYPIDVFHVNYIYVDEKKACEEYKKLTFSLDRTLLPDFRNNIGETYILIIGETARRDALSAYGYPKATSPYLDKFIQDKAKNTVLFSNAISASAYTRGSVLVILSPFDLVDIKEVPTKPNLTKVFKGAGCETLYVTTRPEYPRPNTLSIFQDDAEEVHYLSTLRDKKYDEATLPIIREFLRKYAGKKKFIVLHLMGSHINYKQQYPENFKYFNSGDKWRDSYDDSIRYTDYVIQQAVDLAMNTDQPACVLYASDHGENFNDYGDKNYGHGTRELTRFEFEIPLVFFFNDSFLKKYPEAADSIRKNKDKSVSHDNICHTFLGLAGIKDPVVYNGLNDLASPAFTEKDRYVIDENMFIYNYAALKLDKRPLKTKKK